VKNPAPQEIERENAARQQAQEALRLREERFRNLTAASFEGICISEHGRILDLNDQFAVLFGGDHPSLAGREIVSLIAPEWRELIRERIAMEREEPFEHRAMRLDGTQFDAEAQSKHILWGERRVRVTAIRDITERKRTEAELRENQKRMALVFENSSDFLALYELDAASRWRLASVNRAYLKAAKEVYKYEMNKCDLIGRTWKRSKI
jgi:PAS domain S-box-containing protein